MFLTGWLEKCVRKKWNMKEGKIQMVSSQVGHSANSGNALGKKNRWTLRALRVKSCKTCRSVFLAERIFAPFQLYQLIQRF